MRDALTFATEYPPEAFLRLVTEQGVTVYHLKKNGNTLSFSIKNGDKKRLFVLSERYGIPLTEISDGTRKTFFKSNLFRLGLWLGLAVFIAASVIYSLFVTRYEISGAERTEGEIRQKMESYALPLRKEALDIKRLRREINELDGVASASVYLAGNTVVIHVAEELEEVELFDRSDYADVVSNYDATVTRVIPFDGAVKVSVGQEVKSGDVLLSSQVPLDETGELYYQTRPFGEIYGIVRFKKEVFVPDERIERVRTGAAQEYSTFFVPIERDSPFPLYETERSEYYFYNLLPIKVCRTIYYELQEVSVQVDAEMYREQIVATEREKFLTELPEHGEKSDFSYDIKRLDKATVFSLYYDIEIKINP
ncbi:MAG: sporulation protein YqfD [Clostridia bacterium]|nr:sporulation protein YqfD [Clostridia bacterium]